MNQPRYHDHALSDAELETVVGGSQRRVYQKAFPAKRDFPHCHFPKFQREAKFDYRRNFYPADPEWPLV